MEISATQVKSCRSKPRLETPLCVCVCVAFTCNGRFSLPRPETRGSVISPQRLPSLCADVSVTNAPARGPERAPILMSLLQDWGAASGLGVGGVQDMEALSWGPGSSAWDGRGRARTRALPKFHSRPTFAFNEAYLRGMKARLCQQRTWASKLPPLTS